MNKIRWMPTEYEKGAIRFNKKIEIIQTVCHVLGALGLVAFFFWAYGLSTIEDEVSITSAIMETLKGMSGLGVSFLLMEM